MAPCRILGLAAALGALCLGGLSSRPGAAFVAPRRSYIVADQASRGLRGVGVPCRRRASTGRCLEEATQAESALQVPEANYFTTAAAQHCIEDGCPVEEMESLVGRLQRDEPRIQAAIEQLETTSKASGAAEDTEQEIEWLQHFLTQSRDLRERLYETVFSQNLDVVKDIGGSIRFGNGPTGGFLYMHPKAVTH